MQKNRRDALSAFASILATVTGLTTVARSYLDKDITQYTESQLPLAEIQEPAEDVSEELTSRRQMMRLDLVVRVHFVSWAETPSSTYETLMKNIRNKIGVEFCVSDAATRAWVVEVSKVDGKMPYYFFDMGINLLYYLDQQDV